MKKLRFKTELPPSTSKDKISHKDQILLVGSCFSNDIGNKLKHNKFRTSINPLGVLYDPISISQNLILAMEGKDADEGGVVTSHSCYYHLDFHSDLSGYTKAECLQEVNSKLKECKIALDQSNHLFITLGTAWVYRHNESGRRVANCHKLLSNDFSKELLEPQEIQSSVQEMLERLLKNNPEIKVVFTLSPVRHLKDGMHENQVSKSTLMLAIHSLVKNNEQCSYFPSFEIMMDDLRDYRFYKNDLIHPSSLAIDYIWRCFSESFFNISTFQIIEEVQSVLMDLGHTAFHPKSPDHQQFLQKLEKKINKLSQKHQLDFSQEIKTLEKGIYSNSSS